MRLGCRKCKCDTVDAVLRFGGCYFKSLTPTVLQVKYETMSAVMQFSKDRRCVERIKCLNRSSLGQRSCYKEFLVFERSWSIIIREIEVTGGTDTPVNLK